jgi:glyoxylase-like metal-dependent hydrolase (beta-lactamase superfamily II)
MQIGEYQVDVVSGGPFKLDGGSMFGIIPKPLWERAMPADDRNRIQLDTNCALLRRGSEVVLVDTGNGNKLGDKERDIFAIDPAVTLSGSLAALGLRPTDVTHVVFTHLHMDHAGGGTVAGEDGGIVPTFPNARYCVQRGEWEDALHNRSTMRISYRPENLFPLEESGQLVLLEGDSEILPGLRVHVSGGHTRAHQVLLIEGEERPGACFGDLIPTVAHLRGPYLMAYDLYPYDTMRAKLALLDRAAREQWIVLFDHDPARRIARVVDEGGGRFAARDA